MTPSVLNAGLNGVSTALVALGWVAIRRQRQLAHVVCLTAATVVSAVFLASFGYGFGTQGSGAILRGPPGALGYVCGLVYVSHVVTTLATPFLVTLAYVPVWRQHWNVHRRIGRLALPVWLYASASGVLAFLLSKTVF